MSENYRARNEDDGSTVIIQVLNIKSVAEAEVARFNREYNFVKKLNIAGLVRLQEFIVADGSYALVFENIVDESVESHLVNHSRFSISKFLEVAISISSILGELHKEGGAHKNLTPTNIIVDEENRSVKLKGFGFISELLHENEAFYDRDIMQRSLPYISPEQTGRMNRSVDYRTDFYSLGIIFYEMLAGFNPFSSDDPLAIIHSHMAMQPEALSTVQPDIPKVLSDIVLKLMAKNNEDRYQNGFGLMADFIECQKQYALGAKIDTFEIAKYDVSHKFIVPEKLFGRESEVTDLLAAFDRLYGPAEGESSCSAVEVMLVCGEPGVGKSTLLNEIHKPLVARRGNFLAGKYDQFQRDQPYSAIIQAFRGLVKQILSETDEIIEQWKENLMLALGPNGKIITDVIPDVELIIGEQPSLVALGAEESRNRFKFVFEEFVSVLPSEAHPIVLCLDDLQWADIPSLLLLKNITTSPRVHYLYLIGSFRNNEIDTNHPLSEMISELAALNVPINKIDLGPIRPVDIANLIENFLKCSEAESLTLANLVHNKTGGNPFFVIQFLEMLHHKNLISLDTVLGWKWDVDGITRLQVTDNVVELLAGKIEELSLPAGEILKTSAAIGGSFDLEMLSFVIGKPIDKVLEGLTDSINEGLVSYSQSKECYLFNHDRIQEAAYSLVPEYQKSALHYSIGRKAFEQASRGNHTERSLFYIVDQLNLGVDQIALPEERENLANLNLQAGIKAKASSAFSPAFTYLQLGIHLLTDQCWESQYDLTLSLYTEIIEAAYLSGDYDTMDKLVDTALEHTKSVLDKVRITSARIYACKSRADYEGSIDAALEILRSLGKNIPKNPSKLRIGIELIKLKFLFWGRTPEEMLDLPQSEDPVFTATIKILVSMGVSAFFLNPNLLALSILISFKGTYKKGITPDHAFGSVGYGLIQTVVLHKVDVGLRYGKLGFAFIDKYGTKNQLASCMFVYNAILYHWKYPLKDTITPLLEGYKIGLEQGDLDYAAFNLQLSDLHSLLVGKNLAEAAVVMAKHNQIIKGLNQHDILIIHSIMCQAVANFRGLNDKPEYLTGELIEAEILVPEWIESKNSAALAIFYFSRFTVRFVFSEYALAMEDCREYKKYQDSMKGAVLDRYANVFESVCLIMLYPKASIKEKISIRFQIGYNQWIMKRWAKNSPENCMAMYLCTAGFSKWRFHGDFESCKKYLEQGLSLSEKPEDLLIHGVINEYSTHVYDSIGYRKSAAASLNKAYNVFSQWGAFGKLKLLRKQYPEYLGHLDEDS